MEPSTLLVVDSAFVGRREGLPEVEMMLEWHPLGPIKLKITVVLTKSFFSITHGLKYLALENKGVFVSKKTSWCAVYLYLEL